MRSGRVAQACALASLLALAGCVGGDSAGDGDANLEKGRGLVRGVVLDDAIRPIAGANVTVTAPGQPALNATTGDDGLFQFVDLDPGVYLVAASKRGYSSLQLAATVESDIAEPDLVKVQLAAETRDLQFANQFKWEMFVECSASIGNWCGIVNFYPCVAMQQAGQPCFHVTSDKSLVYERPSFTDLQRIPAWLQMEAFWESTQTLSSSLGIRYSAQNDTEISLGRINYVLANVIGDSPLVAWVPGPENETTDVGYMANSTWYNESQFGVDRGLTVELFHGKMDAAPSELEQYACIPENPSGVWGCWSNQWVGVAASQRVSVVATAFYGYQPPEGWAFTGSGEVPPPPA